MSAISAAYQCGNCAEWHDQEEEALECCAPTAIDGWKCDACGDHHKLKANAEACCGFQCAECAGWNDDADANCTHCGSAPAEFRPSPAMLEAAGQQRLSL